MNWTTYISALSWIWGTGWGGCLIVSTWGYFVVPRADPREAELIKGIIASLLLGLPAWGWLLARMLLKGGSGC